MDYLLLITTDETATPQPGTEEFDGWMSDWLGFTQRIMEGGHYVAGAALQPTATATTLRRTDGAAELLDGPFIETKEQIGGFYVVSAADLDEALELAHAIPVRNGSIEVRPLAIRPDA